MIAEYFPQSDHDQMLIEASPTQLFYNLPVTINDIPYILAYKLQNLRPNLDQKVGGGATYTRVIKKKCFRLVEPVSCHDNDTPGE